MRFIVLLFSLMAFSVSSATYFIDATNGNNGNAGTSSGTAWKTVQKGLDTAVAGDIVNVLAGTYTNEFLVSKKDGTSASPILFVGERAGDGSWRSIIDPSVAFTNNWTGPAANNIYRQDVGFTTVHLTINGKRVANVEKMGDKSADIASAYTGSGLTAGSNFMALASAATLTLTINSAQVITFWDGIEALWGPNGNITYLKMRDGSSPNGLNIRATPAGATLIVTNKWMVFSNLQFQGSLEGIKLRSNTCNNVVLASNYVINGDSRIGIDSGAFFNTVRHCTVRPDYYGYDLMGAWLGGSSAQSGIRAGIYQFFKYIATDQSATDDYGISVVNGAGPTNAIVQCLIDKHIGVGVNLSSQITTYQHVTNTIVTGCTITNCDSVGILVSDGHNALQVYSNNFADSDINIRLHHVGQGGDTNRSGNFYRNNFQLPTGIGSSFHIHAVPTTPRQEVPFFNIYHNSFSGGRGGFEDNGNGGDCRALTNCVVVNNVFSGAPYYYSESASWTNASVIGTFDFNLVYPLPTFPSTNVPAWFCASNRIDSANQWANAYGMSFVLPDGSLAVDRAVDVTSTFTACGHSVNAFPVGSDVKIGVAWDMGAFEKGTNTPGLLGGLKLRGIRLQSR